MGHRFGSGSNPAQTRMGYEEIRKRALQDHNPDALIGLEFPTKFVEFLRQNFIKKIYRWVIDADEYNSGIESELETFVIRVSHGSDSIFGTVKTADLSARKLLDEIGESVVQRRDDSVPQAGRQTIHMAGQSRAEVPSRTFGSPRY